MNYEAMQKRNIFDRDIVNQPEIEYRKAKPPFVIKHKIIDGEERTWYSTHCPVCFWDNRYGLWECMVDKNVLFCRRCGQKIDWSDADGNQVLMRQVWQNIRLVRNCEPEQGV